MSAPSSQRYASDGRRAGIDPVTLQNALAVLDRIRATDPRITPVLTLRHFSVVTEVHYLFLRRTVARRGYEQYRIVFLKKRIPGRSAKRMISIPPKSLAIAQRWLVDNVLRYTHVHSASFAFHPDSSPIQAAEQHPNTQWLLKVDIEDFFHSVSEGTVAAVFARLGFPKLLSFEFARLCTIDLERPPGKNPAPHAGPIAFYAHGSEGCLPQGAPTSPMLANLAMFQTDTDLARLAAERGVRYSRYADDLAFSVDNDRSLVEMHRLRRDVCKILNANGFRHNQRKTVIRGPGTRRIILGMLVDGPTPRLQRAYKDMIRLHLHYLSSSAYGPAKHALARKTGISSLYHHVRGLISWAQLVEPVFGLHALERFVACEWPAIQPHRIESDWGE